MNRELTAADMRKAAQSEVVRAYEEGWYEMNWGTWRPNTAHLGRGRAQDAKRTYLGALVDGPKTSREIAGATSRKVNSIRERMAQYVDDGLVSVDMRPSGSVYTLTRAGLEWLAKEL